MKRPYKYIRLKQGSPEWKQFRHETGLGASEVSSALAMTSKELAGLVYTSPLKLFLEKLDEPTQRFTGNISSEEGGYQESSIIERFKYYDLNHPDQLSIYDRIKNKRPVNGTLMPKNVVSNPKFPWLFFSPDGFMTKSLRSREPIAILEGKLTTSMESQRYTNKVNPSHFIQVMTGLMITGLDVGYLLQLIDGKWFEVTPIQADKEVMQWIETETADFWMRVVKARMIKIEYNIPYYFGVNPELLTQQQRDGVALITELEPSLTGNDSEIKFLKEMLKPTPEYTSMPGTQEQWELCIQYKELSSEKDAFEERKNKIQFELIKSLGGFHEAKFDDGKMGYFSYKPDKNGKQSIIVKPK